MNIQIGPKHRITSDSLNVTVEELSKPREEGSEPKWYAVAYFQNFGQAAQYILERRIKLCDVSTLEEVAKVVEEAKRDVYEAVNAIGLGL